MDLIDTGREKFFESESVDVYIFRGKMHSFAPSLFFYLIDFILQDTDLSVKFILNRL